MNEPRCAPPTVAPPVARSNPPIGKLLLLVLGASSGGCGARRDPVPGAGGEPALPSFCATVLPSDLAASWQSNSVRHDAGGRLVYAPDAEGNRVPDFSFAGYHAGESDPPVLPEVERVSPPPAGDATPLIQAALDRVALRTPDAKGLRGAVVLAPGTYTIAGTLQVRASGTVLRGAGDGGDPAVSSILRAVGDSPHQRDVVQVGAGWLPFWMDRPQGIDVTTERVPVNATSFDVSDASALAVDGTIMIVRPSTPAWIAALHGGGGSVPWVPGDVDTQFLRRVTAITENQVTVDVPLYDTLDRALSQSVVFPVDAGGLAREVGVESLRIEVEIAGGADEDHAWNAIDVLGAEDAWVRGVTALHFGYAAVRLEQARRVTVSGCRGLDPVATVAGGRMYNFTVEHHVEQALFVDCEARAGRHHFVSNGISTASDIVFLRGASTDAKNTMEGHRRWSQALLFDSIVDRGSTVPIVVGLYNRGDYGTTHGWGAVHSVVWRHDTGGGVALVQQPPLGQNYAFGVIGAVTDVGPFPGPAGHVESGPGDLVPHSLYEAQLCDRLARSGRR